ncbi:hypothetical protein N7448_009410 [Penicillium atrosanguineum]|nr:hypothetical protein N7448_009410 [Penicillium atrosanguineum]
MTALYFAMFLFALGRTIIGTAVPSITDEFNSFGDISWRLWCNVRTAAQTVPFQQDAPVGFSILTFLQVLGGTIFVTVSKTLLETRLMESLDGKARLNSSANAHGGVKSLRNQVSKDQLEFVLRVYDDSLSSIFYLNLTLSCMIFVASFGFEWKSVKKNEKKTQGKLQALRMMPEPELQDLLAQLARFYRTNEASISASRNLTTGTLYHSSRAGLDCGPSVTATRTTSASAVGGDARQHWLSVNSPAGYDRQGRSSQHQEVFSSVSKRNDDQLPIGSPRPGESNTSSQSTPCSHFDANTTTASPTSGETTPLHVATEDDDTFGTLTLSPSTRLLLESCKTDRGKFLREIEEARTALPTGQGWEAAIATKEDNADLRDRMKVYHRFECYNIYKHVVEAGYHTGTHWIRDMRTALANKLCQDFPQRFPDQKAVNKSLNWVDQGCKYHEWAGQFRSEGIALGYLIALPLDVPHSAYAFPLHLPPPQTTQSHLGIDNLVRDLELSELGDHIAGTLRDLTGRKRKDIHDATEGSRKLPRLTASSSPSTSHALAVRPGQNLTPPESLVTNWDGNNNSALEMECSVDPHPFGQPTCVNVCRSIAETYAAPYNSPFNISTYDPPASLVLHANRGTVNLSPSAYSGLLHSPDYNAALESFDELCQDANHTEDLSSPEPLLTFICSM